MERVRQLPNWVVFVLVGLPQLAETLYSPSLPALTRDLMISAAVAEYTISVSLCAFSLGMLFWGRVSDGYGRKPCILVGLTMHLIGCIGCYYAGSIEWLMASKFVQSFGATAGNVLGLVMLRDVYHGKELSRICALVVSALGVAPAIGPTIGGFIAQKYGWQYNFLFLSGAGLLVMLLIFFLLPETLPVTERRSVGLYPLMLRMIGDRQAMAGVFFVGMTNGLMFSYYAEGAFVMIKLLGLSPIQYGMTFILFACATIIGGWMTSMLYARYEVNQVVRAGVCTIIMALLCSVVVVGASLILPISNVVLLSTIVVVHVVTMGGRCLVTSSAISAALSEYRDCSGVASSVFCFLSYGVTTLCTAGMGFLHNGTLFPLPFYFLFLALCLLVVERLLAASVRESGKS